MERRRHGPRHSACGCERPDSRRTAPAGHLGAGRTPPLRAHRAVPGDRSPAVEDGTSRGLDRDFRPLEDRAAADSLGVTRAARSGRHQARPGALHRRKIVMTRKNPDALLSAGGLVVAAILLVAGGLLLWAHSFVEDQVTTQLSAQQI